MEAMLRTLTRRLILSGGVLALFLVLGAEDSCGFVCSGSMYNNPSFQERVITFSPYEKVYLIIDCKGLPSGTHTMHANWIHQQRGMIRSDKHEFTVEEGRRKGIYFWFKLSKKGPLASMFTNQDFHEENFGDWVVEAYLNDQLILTHPFSITDGVER